MKIRKGFISNSSSSSFIVIYNNQDHAKGKLCKKIDLYDLIENAERADSYCEDTEIKFHSKKKILSELKDMTKRDYFDEISKKELEEIIEQIKSVDINIQECLYFDLSYHSRIVRDIIDIMVEEGDVNILQKEDQ